MKPKSLKHKATIPFPYKGAMLNRGETLTVTPWVIEFDRRIELDVKVVNEDLNGVTVVIDESLSKAKKGPFIVRLYRPCLDDPKV